MPPPPAGSPPGCTPTVTFPPAAPADICGPDAPLWPQLHRCGIPTSDCKADLPADSAPPSAHTALLWAWKRRRQKSPPSPGGLPVPGPECMS